VIGGSGWLGASVVREGLRRGHELTVIARDAERLAETDGLDGATRIAADVRDEGAIADALRGHDAIVLAVTDRTTPERSVIPDAVEVLLRVLPGLGSARLLVIGGGGSLETAPGVRVVDSPDFPAQYKNEALAQAKALELLRGEGAELDWSYLSPPPHDLTPGERTGTYRVQAGEAPLEDHNGVSTITSGDLASALVDEIEQPRFSRRRFTAAY